VRDRRLQGVQAVIRRQERVPTESDDDRFLFFTKNGRAKLSRPRLAILERLPLPPPGDRLRIDPELPAQLRVRSLRSLYCCSDGVRARGAAVTYLDRNIKPWDQTARAAAELTDVFFMARWRRALSKTPSLDRGRSMQETPRGSSHSRVAKKLSHIALS